MNNPGDRDEDLEYQDGEIEATWEEEEQLDLTDEDEDLPWLEADEYEEEGGFDFRLIWITLIGLAAIAALLYGLWWLTKDRPDPEMVPDGSTIEAPEGAYKVRPEEGADAEVEGTGSQAFQVAEGEQDRGRVAGEDGGDSPRPTIDVDQSGDDASGAAGGAAATPAATSGSNVYVQIGAFGSQADAEAAWRSATGRFSVLSGMRYRVVEGDVNGARVYRLQAIAGDRATADATCRAIRNGGGDCYIR
ncbi:SPOR domain-containing protein [Erythrobacter sp. EC-HK427]|uniref:SPOR domain-containing protein n=1 Tax=Erythrobacter sp. EC-HK427 TaxID=2038396 RepID=UPI001252CFBD|nr:SPOR domain-containing protein [Erythrobacter sp. EC-HK427]VVS97866.1 conserved hypothetical protein [Erythrobacter sp. EC-HK427]